MASADGAGAIERDVDAVVVGAGPGGCIAARDLARRGLRVLLLDRKQEIGAPKRCAEGITHSGLAKVGLEPHASWAANPIDGAVLYSPGGHTVDVPTGGDRGYILERKVFEKVLAGQAIEAGAECMVKVMVEDVLKEQGRVVGVLGTRMGRPVRVRARLVIGADGIDSLVGRKAGLRTLQRMRDYFVAAQYEMAGVRADPTRIHLFFGKRLAPKGYAWIFPKGHGLANVGVAMLTTESRHGERALDYLDRWIRDRPDLFQGASPVEFNASGIPVSSGLKRFWGDGILLVGDAAHQVNPIHGGGIPLAMHAGALAADVAAQALAAGEVSTDRLADYGRRWQDAEGRELERLYKFRMFMESLTDEDMDRIATVVTGDVVLQLSYARFRTFARLLMTRLPTLLPLLVKYVRAPGREGADAVEALEA